MIERIDHLVLTVADIERTLSFYQRVLRMQPIRFGEGRSALAFGNQKLNLHAQGNEFEPKATHPTPGAIDLCLITQWPMAQLLRHLREQDVEVEEGPVARTGAIGAIESVYFRDPDGNLIEVSRYPD